MPKCVFCGKEYNFHEGVTLVKNDGTINYICSSKCRKNMKMKRRKVRWVHLSEEEKTSRKAKKK